MMEPIGNQERETRVGPNGWQALAERALAGRRLTFGEALAVLRSDDAEILDLLGAVYRVRRAFHGNRVHLNFLVNAQSGRCGEDCGYCSQSRVSTAEIPKYPLLKEEEIVAGARVAAERGAGTYCIVTSGRGPIEAGLVRVESAVGRIKAEWGLSICVSPGLLTLEQARRLKAVGVDRVNHNLNTSQRYYAQICTTHTYQDRLNTLRAVRAAGMEICSGGIIGMGESDEDVVELALRLGELEVEALPINFWLPIEGTSLAAGPRPAALTPRYCLKALALFRLANPKGVLRMAAGRDVHLGCLQPLGLFAADSMFVGDYLTTKNQPPAADYRMIEDLGFEVVEEA